jgi:hypothetical protein
MTLLLVTIRIKGYIHFLTLLLKEKRSSFFLYPESGIPKRKSRDKIMFLEFIRSLSHKKNSKDLLLLYFIIFLFCISRVRTTFVRDSR